MRKKVYRKLVKMGRRKKKSTKKVPGDGKLNKEELKKRYCYEYAKIRNFNIVAKQFGCHPESVRRAWNELSEEERMELENIEVDVNLDLNDKLLIAEKAAGDSFIEDVMAARIAAGRELRNRFQHGKIEFISNKDFASLLRLIAVIAPATEKEKESAPKENNTFRAMRDSIMDDINNPK